MRDRVFQPVFLDQWRRTPPGARRGGARRCRPLPRGGSPRGGRASAEALLSPLGPRRAAASMLSTLAGAPRTPGGDSPNTTCSTTPPKRAASGRVLQGVVRLVLSYSAGLEEATADRAVELGGDSSSSSVRKSPPATPAVGLSSRPRCRRRRPRLLRAPIDQGGATPSGPSSSSKSARRPRPSMPSPSGPRSGRPCRGRRRDQEQRQRGSGGVRCAADSHRRRRRPPAPARTPGPPQSAPGAGARVGERAGRGVVHGKRERWRSRRPAARRSPGPPPEGPPGAQARPRGRRGAVAHEGRAIQGAAAVTEMSPRMNPTRPPGGAGRRRSRRPPRALRGPVGHGRAKRAERAGTGGSSAL